MIKSSLLAVSVLFFTLQFQSSSYAVDLGSFGDRIFTFQEKLAKSGNKLAQYKLGTLYEWGVSVPANLSAARQWYEKAAAQDYEPAINRLTYLEVKERGFDEQKHGEWFDRVMNRVDQNEPDAMILLGQMNRYGIVVEQNTNLAVVLLQRASSLGHTEVDSQIDELKHEIREANARKKAAEVAEKPEPKPKPRPVAKAKPEPRPKPAPKPAVDTQAEKESMEERRQRYEEAMRKLYEESKVLEEQQEWAESR